MVRWKMYTVRCTEPIAQEMRRYENARIVSSKNFKCDEIWLHGNRAEEMKNAYGTWEFTFASPAANPARWRSFGCEIHFQQ